jgi:1,4-alpha-glucan branching enzyme
MGGEENLYSSHSPFSVFKLNVQNMIKNTFNLICLLLLSPFALFAQVTVTPEFPTADEEITIVYDATQGTSALEGASSVHMHSGAILEENGTGWENVVGDWGDPNSPGKMTSLGDNKWEIKITPRSYYGVPDGTPIYRLGMVFRESGPCQSCAEGKNDENSDIFVDLFESGLNFFLTQPKPFPNVIFKGDSLTINATASEAADLKFEIIIGDSTATLAEAAGATALNHVLKPDTLFSSQTFRMYATTQTDTVDVKYAFSVRTPAEVAPRPDSLQDGITYLTDKTKLGLVLHAPGKSDVVVVGDFTNWENKAEYQMKRDGSDFWIILDGLTPGKDHTFYYLVDNQIRVADPYSTLILDPSQDQFISESTFPGLSYPEGAPDDNDDRLTVINTDEPEFVWDEGDYVRPAKEDLIIYEMLIRDFTEEQNFQSIIDTLDYIQNLGVNAIEFMPLQEFNGNLSWGYNPTFYMALDKFYGTRTAFKQLVQEAHKRGIAVIVDNVFNHIDYPSPLVKMWWAGSTVTSENPYANVVPKHPFNVFIDMNHEYEPYQRHIDRVNKYWLEEFHVDGFRFDLTKGFTQTDYGFDDVGSWSSLDQGRVDLLKRMADKMWEVDPTSYVIFEHLGSNVEEKILADHGIMLWGIQHGPAKDMLLTGNGDFSWAYSPNRNWLQLNAVAYMESHDEQRLMYDAINGGQSNGDYDVKDEETAIERIKMMASIFYTIPGPKMLWQFGEFGYDIDINFNGRTGDKPLLWNYLDQEENRRMYEFHGELFDLIWEDLNGLKDAEFEMTNTGAVRTRTITKGDTTVFIFANVPLTSRRNETVFPSSGKWYDYFTGDTLDLGTGTRERIEMEPGEFHVMSNKPLFADRLDLTNFNSEPEPPVTTGIGSSLKNAVKAYPNPSNGYFKLLGTKSTSAVVYNTVGEAIGSFSINGNTVDLTSLENGLYFLQVEEGTVRVVKR